MTHPRTSAAAPAAAAAAVPQYAVRRGRERKREGDDCISSMATTTVRRARVVEGSCWHCKSRRVKCDLAKPTCGRCQRSELECGYGVLPFKWVGGMALRGRHAPSAQPEVQTVGTDRSGFLQTAPRTPNNGTSAWALSVPLASPIDQNTLVPYFVHAVLPRYCLGDFVISLDHDVLLRDEALRGAMLAIARAHFDMQAKNGSALARTRSRQTAIASFRKQLASGAHEDAVAQDLFSTNVLFCLLDGMINPVEETNASIMHLKGGFAMLDRWTDIVPNMISKGGIRTHLLSIFTTLDLVHSILSGCKPHFEPTIYRQLAGTESWWGRLDPDDAIIAASENLCRLAALGNLVHSSLELFGRDATQQRVFYFESMLSDELRTYFDKRQDLDDQIHMAADDWTVFCALYDLSARIFYERAIRLASVDDAVVQRYTKRATLMVGQKVFSGMLQHCIVLPLVIIGAHCLEAHTQAAISCALSPTVSYLSFGCLPMMEQFLRATWGKRDLAATWWETFADIAEKIFLF